MLKNNEGRFAPKLQGNFLVALRCRFTNCAAYFRRTCERNLVHIRMLHQRFTGGTVTSDNVHHTGGQTHSPATFPAPPITPRPKLTPPADPPISHAPTPAT